MRDEYPVDLIILRQINNYFMVLIKGFEQDPDLGMKIVPPSISDESEAKNSDKQENIEENAPKTPYDGEIITDSSDDEENNDEVVTNPHTNEEIINANSDEVNPDTPTNDVQN